MFIAVLTAALLFGQSSPQAALVLERLDMTSFRDSTGAAHLPTPSTPAASGFTDASVNEGWAILSRPTNPWRIGLKILAIEDDAIHACFSDVAWNGGGYFVQTALVLKLSGLGYVAEPSPRHDCREMRSRADGAPAAR